MRKVLSILLILIAFVSLNNVLVFAQADDFDDFGGYQNDPDWDWNYDTDWTESDADSSNSWWEWDEGVCPWDDKDYIILNTNVPFVWRCIKKEFDEWSGDTNASNVFPKLMAYMIRIMMTVLVVWWFLWILVWGFMIASNGAFGSKQTWVKLILGVIAGLILLWASGIILNLINPNFFGTAS